MWQGECLPRCSRYSANPACCAASPDPTHTAGEEMEAGDNDRNATTQVESSDNPVDNLETTAGERQDRESGPQTAAVLETVESNELNQIKDTAEQSSANSLLAWSAGVSSCPAKCGPTSSSTATVCTAAGVPECGLKPGCCPEKFTFVTFA